VVKNLLCAAAKGRRVNSHRHQSDQIPHSVASMPSVAIRLSDRQPSVAPTVIPPFLNKSDELIDSSQVWRAPVPLPTHESVQVAPGRAMAWVTILPNGSTSSPAMGHNAGSRQNEDNPNI